MNEYENWNDGQSVVLGFIAFVTAELKDYGVSNEDIYSVIEDHLGLIINRREEWEDTTHRFFESIQEKSKTGSVEEFISEIKKRSVHIEYEDE